MNSDSFPPIFRVGLRSVPADDDQTLLAARLLMRGMSAFQGAIVMAERGMTTEARTLARSCFETVFCLGALRKDPRFVEAFTRDDASRRKKLACALLKLDDDSSGLEPAHTGKLTRFLDELAESGL